MSDDGPLTEQIRDLWTEFRILEQRLTTQELKTKEIDKYGTAGLTASIAIQFAGLQGEIKQLKTTLRFTAAGLSAAGFIIGILVSILFHI